MSRPIPLDNLTTARRSSDFRVLTPRTPHSRSGRAEEGYTEAELEDVELEELQQYRAHSQQSIPLLATDNSFPPTGWRARGDDFNGTRKFQGLTLSLVLSRLPMVVGGLVAAFLLVIIYTAIEDPDSPPDYVLNNATDSLIQYTNYTTFPLQGVQYRAECEKLFRGFMPMGDYWDPPMSGVLDVPHLVEDTFAGMEGPLGKICSSTITYQLDGTVGLSADLALMAQAAALARERNRTFLVDDTYWNRGKWIDYFQDVRLTQVGPEPGCRVPPPNELVACPRLARHWVVNARTAKFHFGHGFANHYEDAYAHDLNRLKPIFEFAQVSLSQTILPSAEMTALIHRARSKMSDVIRAAAVDRGSPPGISRSEHAPSYIGIHIRRGDQRPSLWDYHRGYVPIAKYADSANHTWSRLLPSVPHPMTVWIASDSPSAQGDLVKALPADTRMLSLSLSKDQELTTLESPKEYVQAEFAQMSEDSRKRQTRGMIVDLAMVAGIWNQESAAPPEATICTIKSSVCQLSAVGLGWERSFGTVDEMGQIDKQRQRWVEIDQAGQIVPVWEAFQLFS